MQDVLRLGLVGCGGISRGLYVDLLTGFADRACVVAVCDLMEARAQERSAQFHDTYQKKALEYQTQAGGATSAVEKQHLSELAEGCTEAGKSAPRIFTDLERFVGNDELQAVIVATQPLMHPVASAAAAEAGRHVFTEGPLAANLRDADAALEAARRHGVQLCVQNCTRFFREALQAKLAIQSGKLGKIVMGRVDASWYHTMASYFLKDAYRGTWKGEGGGSVFHHGRYASDLYLHLMDEPMQEVAAFTGTLLHDIEVEDASSAVVRFQSGALGHVTTTTCSHQNKMIPHDRVEILGELASLQVFRALDFGLSIGSKDPEYAAGVRAYLDEAIPFVDEDIQVTQMRLFLDAIRTGGVVPVPGDTTRPFVELVRATYKSAFTGQIAELPLAKDDPFYGPEGTLPR
jgi:UDP-N-acetyl-2-amino-2-deoxyglucuronate dehydrogenase